MKKILTSLLFIALCIMDCSDSKDDPIPEISGAFAIQMFDINNRGNASDIRVFFNSNTTLAELKEFRLILVPEALVSAVSIADFPESGSAVLIIAADKGLQKLTLSAGLTDFQGKGISVGEAYRVAVASIHAREGGNSPVVISNESITLEDSPLQDLYVSNSRGNSVVIIDEITGELIGNFIRPGAGQLTNTQELIRTDEGEYLVTGFGNSAIKRYNANGGLVENFTRGYTLGGPTKTSVGPDNLLYVSQWQNNINNVARFDYDTGDFVDEFVTGVDRAMGHAWDAEGNYYLASFGTPSVIKYNSEGERLMTIGSAQLAGPVNVWIKNSQKQLFVVDWPNGTVKIFNMETGEFQGNFISGMQRVEGFLFGENNALYLCDWLANSVNEYDATSGSLRRSMPISILNNPNGIIYGPNVDPQ